MNDLYVITGARNTGKSYTAATFLKPSEISRAFVHDSEKSMNRVIERLEANDLAFGHYTDLNARFSDLPDEDDLLARINAGQLPWVDAKQRNSLVAYYKHILDDLATNLTRGKYKVYIHDTIEKLEAGMAAWVEAHKKASGVTRTAYGGLWTQGVYPLYEHLIASIFDRGVETIIFTSHLKTPWEGNHPVTNKVAPAGKKILYKLSSLFLWLVNDRNNHDGAPAGLVLKERLGDLRPVDDEWVIQRMLPERIPHCTWKDIRAYLDNGCDLANPARGEAMTTAEREMISELLTDEQMRLMMLDAEKELEEMKAGMLATSIGSNSFNIEETVAEKERLAPSNAAANDIHSTISDLSAQGLSPEDISEKVGRPVPVVKIILSRIQSESE